MRTGRMQWKYGETAYTVFGDLSSELTPLVILHGGPGSTSRGMATIAQYVLATGRPAITYDQIGCGESSELLDKPQDFWQISLFVEECEVLINHLGIAEKFSLLGHSWGGLLAAEMAITQPAGLQSIILSSALGDTQTWMDEVRKLVHQMPEAIAQTIIRHEDGGTTDDPEYMVAAEKFYDLHVIRIPKPPHVLEYTEQSAAHPNVYHSMWGRSELNCTGTLNGHIVTDRLVNITAQTLILSGRHDESTPAINEIFKAKIVDSAWEIFEESAHYTYLEEAGKYQRVINSFLESS